MEHNDFIMNYSFTVNVNGLSTSFAKVTNLSGSAEIDSIVVGGQNNSPHIMVKPKKNPDMLILERGCRTSVKDMLFSTLSEGKKIENMMIVCKRNGKTCRIFSISEGIVVKREFSSLDAMGNEVLVQMLQIAHAGLTQIAIPFETSLM